jgi:hypothetical protein
MSYLIRIREEFLAPSRWVHGLLNLLLTFVALAVSEAVLVRNQRNYVYPSDGDSIGIPLMGMMFYGLFSLACFLFAMGLVRRGSGVRWFGYALLGLIALGYLYLEIRRHRIKIRSTQNV